MTALGKVTGFRLQVTVLLISISLLLFLYPVPYSLTTAFAQEDGADCQYTQKLEDGTTELCNGAYQPEDLDDPNSGLVCRFNAAVPPDCKKQLTASPSPSPNSNLGTGPAGDPITPQNYKAPQHSNYTILNLEHSLFCELAGMSPVGACLGLKKEPGLADATPLLYDRVPSGGAIGGLTTFVVAMYTPPTSTARYLADLGTNLGIVKPTYAQVGGSGAGIINPILELWRAMRNISYVVFIIVFVAVGVMIMFRTRINPQTVISVQQALPGLVVGLILVTFSYFIAALLIDTAFVAIQVVGQIFTQADTKRVLGDPTSLAQDSNVFKLFTGSIRLPENISDFTGGIYTTLFGAGGGGAGSAATGILLPAIIGLIIGTIIAPGIGSIIGLGAGAAAGLLILGLIIPLILILALLIQFFRLLWQLISSYIAILVTTVTGPLIILIASIPGRGGLLGLWWKSLLGNALVFPAVFATFMFAGFILGTETGSFNASPPLFGGLSTQLLRLILAYGIILGTPGIPGMVRKAIGVPELGGIPQEAMGGAMAGFGAVQAGGLPLGRGGLVSLYSRTRTFPVGTWQRNLAQTIYNRYGNQPQRHPWFSNQEAPP